jgi:hypothetical protein
VIEPAPVKLKTIPLGPRDPLPVTDGKDPVAPLKLPVPPVMVADPVPDVVVPNNSVVGSVKVPVRVPPDRVIVKGAFTFDPLIEVGESVALNVPFPIFVRVAVPVAVRLVREKVPFTVRVVLVVAACAVAPISSTRTMLAYLLVKNIYAAPPRREALDGLSTRITHHITGEMGAR